MGHIYLISKHQCSLTCRGRHARCDEGRPICGNCRKSRLQCRQPEFVSSKWSALTQRAVAPAIGTNRDEMDQITSKGTQKSHLKFTKSEADADAGIPPERTLDAQGIEIDLVCAPESLTGQETLLDGKNQFKEPRSIFGTLAHSEVAPPAESIVTAEIVHLLRVYEKSIATWMVVFDLDCNYRQHLLCLAPSSPLLINAICALSARQLSLIGPSIAWKPVAEHYYGQAVHLLAHLLNSYPNNMELAVVGTILLCSYELLAFPGLDYQRHFKGANTIINSLHAHKSASCLTRASFWIYARHEVAEALNRSSPTLHDPGSWPKFDLSEIEAAEDSFCNDILRLSAEVACLVFGKTSGSRGKRRKRALSALQDELCDWLHLCPDRWKGTQYDEDGNVRYWFPRPNFGTVLPYGYGSPYHSLTLIHLEAAGLVLYHLCMLLLWHDCMKVEENSENENAFLVSLPKQYLLRSIPHTFFR